MKKLLLCTMLSSLAAPVYAGPLLDTVMPPGLSWTAESSEIKPTAEVYEGVTLTSERGHTGQIQFLTVEDTGSQIVVRSRDATMKDGKQSVFSYDAVDFAVDIDAARGAFNVIDDYIDMTSETYEQFVAESCSTLDVATTMSGENVVIREASGETSFDRIDMSFDIIDPEGDCLMDASFSSEGVSIDMDGMQAKVGMVSAKMYSPMLVRQAPVDMSKDYKSSFDLTDLTISMQGAEQLEIASITSHSKMDPFSVAHLANAGYFDLVTSLPVGPGASGKVDLGSVSVPEVWNALRKANAEGTFSINGMKITGDMASAMTGTVLLQPGRTLDFTSTLSKEGPDFWTNMHLDSKELAKISIGAAFQMSEMDPSIDDAGPQALMVKAPVSITEFAVEFHDEALSEIIQAEMGFDLYAMAESAIASNIGPAKAETFMNWLADAKDGGAYFLARPDTPMPVMMAFMGALGDWDAFGEQINAKVVK